MLPVGDSVLYESAINQGLIAVEADLYKKYRHLSDTHKFDAHSQQLLYQFITKPDSLAWAKFDPTLVFFTAQIAQTEPKVIIEIRAMLGDPDSAIQLNGRMTIAMLQSNHLQQWYVFEPEKIYIAHARRLWIALLEVASVLGSTPDQLLTDAKTAFESIE